MKKKHGKLKKKLYYIQGVLQAEFYEIINFEMFR